MFKELQETATNQWIGNEALLWYFHVWKVKLWSDNCARIKPQSQMWRKYSCQLRLVDLCLTYAEARESNELDGLEPWESSSLWGLHKRWKINGIITCGCSNFNGWFVGTINRFVGTINRFVGTINWFEEIFTQRSLCHQVERSAVCWLSLVVTEDCYVQGSLVLYSDWNWKKISKHQRKVSAQNVCETRTQMIRLVSLEKENPNHKFSLIKN